MSWKPVTDLEALPRTPTGLTLIDSHCHLDGAEFDADRQAVLARAAAVGVGAMVTIGAGGSMESNRRAVVLARTFPVVFATVGIHPHDASIMTDESIDTLRTMAREPKVVAIGETGLDYHYDHSPRPQQREAFRRFVQLARELGQPLIVHLRQADDDALAILREEHAGEVGGVIHCFSSDTRAARAFLDLGFFLSFSGIITFKTAEPVREAARITPADRLLVETDAPYLAPIPYRGRRNEPALVVQTAAVLADIRGESFEAVTANTRENTRRLLRLP